MSLSKHLNCLLDDLVEFSPESLSDIARFVRCHSAFSSIVLMIRNSTRSANFFLKQCQSENSDMELAGLLVIVADLDQEMHNEWVSRIAEGVGKCYHWSRGMAASYLIHKVIHETIRKSA